MTAEPALPAQARPPSRLFAAALIGRTANEMTAVAVVLLVLGRGEGAALAGITAGALALPGIATGPLLGATLDRARRPLRLIAAEQAVGAAGLCALALAVGHVPAALTVALAVLTGAMQPLSTGGMTSVITGRSGEEFVARATSVEAASFGAATVAGPLLAAVLAGAVGAGFAVAVQAVLKLVAMGLTLTDEAGAELAAPAPAEAPAWRATLGDGLRHFAAAGPLAAITACGGIAMAARGLLVVAFPFFAIDPLGREDDFAGVLWAAFAIGSAVGAIALRGLSGRWPSERVALGAVVLAGAAMLPIAALGSTPATLALLLVSGLLYGPGLAATFDLRRRLTPPEFLGQVSTTGASVKGAGFAVGAAVSGALVAAIGAADTILVAGVMHLGAGAIGVLLIALRRRTPRL